MSVEQKLRIGVIRGGISAEYPFSLESGKTILQALPREKYQVVDILVTSDGIWHIAGLPVNPYTIKERVDVVWNALHGDYGEDGRVQSILEELDIPFVGTDSYSSELTYHKGKTKERLQQLGINTPKGFAVHDFVTDGMTEADRIAYIESQAQEIFRTMPGPWIIKPIRGGGSHDVYLAKAFPDLVAVLSKLSPETQDILVEEYIKGIEVVAGIAEGVRGEKTYQLPAKVIRKKTDIFSFADRMEEPNWHSLVEYNSGYKDIVDQHMKDIFREFNLSGVATADFIVTPKGIWVLDIDTVPHFHPYSYTHHATESVGITAEQFVDGIIQHLVKGSK